MDSKKKGLRVNLAFIQRNYLPDGRVNKTVVTVEELTNLWKPGAMDGIPPFVTNLVIMFQIVEKTPSKNCDYIKIIQILIRKIVPILIQKILISPKWD